MLRKQPLQPHNRKSSTRCLIIRGKDEEGTSFSNPQPSALRSKQPLNILSLFDVCVLYQNILPVLPTLIILLVFSFIQDVLHFLVLCLIATCDRPSCLPAFFPQPSVLLLMRTRAVDPIALLLVATHICALHLPTNGTATMTHHQCHE